MKIQNPTHLKTAMPPKSGTCLPPLKRLFGLGLILVSAAASQAAAPLYWDADTTTAGVQDGSGSWTNANMWLSNGVNVAWSNGTNAIFGSGTGSAGTFTVTNNAALVQPSSVMFTNPGSYTITTDGVNTGQLNCTAPGGQVGSFSPGFWVGTNITARIDVPWRLQNGSDMYVGSNSALTISQSTYNNCGTVVLKGAGPLVSRINATNGVWGGPTGAWLAGTMLIAGVTLDISGAGVVNAGTRLDLGRGAPGSALNDGAITVDDGGQLNVSTQNGTDANANLQISRGYPGTVNVLSGGTVTTLKNGTAGNGKVILIPDSSSRAALNVSGGTLSVGIGTVSYPGVSSPSLNLITLMQGSQTYNATASAVFNLSGGIVAAQGLQIGSSGGTFTASPTNQVNITGGTLYLDAVNIGRPKDTGTNFAFNLSGGTIAATANWSPACTVPMNLTNINGDITFQTADVWGTPYNISLAGALTGVGGLKKSGSGVLTLSGANNYSGTTVVSNGTFVVSTINSPTNGPVTLDGSSVMSPNLPINSVLVANVGQCWSIGTLTYSSGTPTADFNFGSFPPSTSVAPIQVGGNLVLTVTPQVTVQGSAIAVGDYPLWHYTGTLSGTVPTTPTSLPSGVVASLVHNSGTKTVYLHVTSSPVNPRLMWAVGNGAWNTTAANWQQYGSSLRYSDGSAVGFDDSASGPFPITVSLDTTVYPSSVQVNGTNAYTIAGTGALVGGTGLEKNGTGTLTLSNVNTYSGGTIVNSGQLNINYGGDGFSSSAIGTGPLTNTLGSRIDNTSGHSITLLTPIAQYWNDDFTFVGTTNLNTGSGTITLGSGLVNLTVSSNVLEVDGLIQDNGVGYALGKLGNGTLTLSNYNYFMGGMQLVAGRLNLSSDGAVGLGPFAIFGGTLDNSSGSPLSLNSPNAMQWYGSFTFAGSSDLQIGGVPISVLADGITLTVSNNTFTTGGIITGGNRNINKNGPGTWTITGGMGNSGLGINVNGGTVNFNKELGANSVNANAVTVNANGTLVMLNPTGTQLGSLVSLNLGGGLVELNGDSETFATMTFNSGILRNSITNSTVNPTRGVSLVGTNCIFDVTNEVTLTIAGTITNSGWLVKAGAGLLTLMTNNTFSGKTLITAGTLALPETGSLSNSAVLAIGTNALLDVASKSNQTLTLNLGQTLTGNGSLNGNVVTLAGSILAPGASVGNLTISNSLTLGGDMLIAVDKSATPVNGQCVVLGGLTNSGTGTMTVTNLGAALAVGDSFKVFSQPLANGEALNIAPAPGPGMLWVNKLAVDGTIAVVAGSLGPVITSLTPTNGLVAGSTTVTISGSGFAANPTVTFGGLAASVTSATDGSIVVVTPSHPLGSVDVTVTNPGLQSATLPNGFAYVVPATPTNLTQTVTATSVTFSWPSDYLGWILQTNSVNVAVSNYWGDVPGSVQTNQMTFPTKNSGLPLEFFRLRHP